MKPVIGIVACGFMEERQFVSQSYIDAVTCAGAVPVILPLNSDSASFPQYRGLCDGFLFCGGDDITPLLFGEEPLTGRGKTDMATDIFHISLMEDILRHRIPVLAICRGMQVLNIALGGTIWQDISLRSEPSIHHMQLSDRRSDTSHRVTLSLNSMLYNICGDTIFVNSFHHQCIRVLGKDLKITGISSDGMIESVESTRHPFVIGVQWHPECMYHTCEAMEELFRQFCLHAETAKSLLPPIS